MTIIPSEHAHADVLAFNRCPGSDTWPTVQTDDLEHGICDTCHQPFRLRHGAVPAHRTRQ